MIVQTIKTSPGNIWVLVVMFGLAFLVEGAYRKFRKNKNIKPIIKNFD